MKWQLKDHEFESFRSLKHGEYLKCSNNFILSGNGKNITFSLLCFPSGHDSKHKDIITFQLYISSSHAIPSNTALTIELSLILQQISFKQSFTLQFHQKQLHHYIASTLPSQELTAFSALTFHWNIYHIDDVKEDETDTPIEGCTQKHTKTLRLDISPFAGTTSIDTKTIWQIKPAQIPLLIKRAGYMLWSDVFIVDKFADNIKFQLQIRNNLNSKYPHSMSLLLHLLQLPRNTKTVTCCASIVCIECKTRSYGVFDMTVHGAESKKSINLLRPYSLEVYEVQNTQSLTFICEVEVLKLTSMDITQSKPLYLKQRRNYNEEIQNYERKISENQLLKFKNAPNGKVHFMMMSLMSIDAKYRKS